MDYKIRIVCYLYNFSLIGLLILYLFPGSLIGYFLYGDLGKQPDMILNPIGTSINHALAFFYLTTIGLISHINQTSFNKILIFLVTLSLFLELLHIIIPKRSFEVPDLLGNILGVLLSLILFKLFIFRRLK